MKTRNCSVCGPQPVDQFVFKNKSKGILQSMCKLCSSKYKHEWHKRNKVTHNARIHLNNKVAIDEIQKKICDYLSSHPCIDCGESDIVVLEFDHIDPSSKTMAIALLMRRSHKWETILNEIEKCVIRCANCHRRKTAKQFKFYRYGRGTEIQTQINGLEDRGPIQLNDASISQATCS